MNTPVSSRRGQHVDFPSVGVNKSRLFELAETPFARRRPAQAPRVSVDALSQHLSDTFYTRRKVRKHLQINRLWSRFSGYPQTDRAYYYDDELNSLFIREKDHPLPGTRALDMPSTNAARPGFTVVEK